jgi:CubicO group peptidase (beta-lactamase class C family)
LAEDGLLLLSDPVSRYQYCTISPFLLGEIVHRLSGFPFPGYLNRRVLHRRRETLQFPTIL